MKFEQVKIFWILSNNEISKPHLVRQLGISLSTLYNLERSPRATVAKTVLRLDAFIESMREFARLENVSLLIPDNLAPMWRWASYDAANGWNVWNCNLSPTWEVDRRIWRRSEQTDTVNLRDLFPKIPADASTWRETVNGEALYKRDPVTGIWIKNYGVRESNPMPDAPYNREDFSHLKELFS